MCEQTRSALPWRRTGRELERRLEELEDAGLVLVGDVEDAPAIRADLEGLHVVAGRQGVVHADGWLRAVDRSAEELVHLVEVLVGEEADLLAVRRDLEVLDVALLAQREIEADRRP